MNKWTLALLNKNRVAAKAAAEAAAHKNAKDTAPDTAPDTVPDTAPDSGEETAREATDQVASLPSPSTAKSVEGLEGGSNGGTPPLPAASGRETGGVAGEAVHNDVGGSEPEGATGNPVATGEDASSVVDIGESKGATGNPVATRATKESKQLGDSVQVRLRLPREFAEMLLAMKPEKRRVALWLSLEGRIGNVWDLPKLTKNVDQLRRAGGLLNQSLRYLGEGGDDRKKLVARILRTMREIKKLRPPKSEEGSSEKPSRERQKEAPEENDVQGAGDTLEKSESGVGKAGEG